MDFYSILKHFHSGWAYVTLLMAILFFFVVGYYLINKRPTTTSLKKISFFTTLTLHIQLLAGLALYFVGPYSKWTEDTMSNATLRFHSVEHPLMMFAAVILITIANSKLKKSEHITWTILLLSLLALVCILSRIPWNTWMN